MEDLIRFSLQKKNLERLVVLLGFMDGGGTSSMSSNFLPRASTACRLEEYIFRNCRPPLNDIHNPEQCRFAARDAKGEGRAYYQAYTQAQKKCRRRQHGSRGSGGGSESLRRPQQWDSAPVPDFMGVWCDRLLLGDSASPKRTALLCPHVPPLFQPQALQQVARSHDQLTPSDVLFVDTTPSLPVGLVRLGTLSQHRRRVPQWVGSMVDRRWGGALAAPHSEESWREGVLSYDTDKDVRRETLWNGRERKMGEGPSTFRVPHQYEGKDDTVQHTAVLPFAGCCPSMEDALHHFHSPSRRPRDTGFSFPAFPPPRRPPFSSPKVTESTTSLPTSTTMVESSPNGRPSIVSSLKNEEPSVLAIGCGSHHLPGAPFTTEEEGRIRNHVLPLAAFVVALWAVNPRIAAEYVVKQTPPCTESTAGECPSPPLLPTHERLWRTMQESMLSTRDTALLRAHFSNTSLDRRLRRTHQTYLAETLLRRLEEFERDSY